MYLTHDWAQDYLQPRAIGERGDLLKLKSVVKSIFSCADTKVWNIFASIATLEPPLNASEVRFQLQLHKEC